MVREPPQQHHPPLAGCGERPSAPCFPLCDLSENRRQPPTNLPPVETVDFLAGAFCHPDQVSEAQAGANAWRDQREAMCLKTRGKEEIASRFAGCGKILHEEISFCAPCLGTSRALSHHVASGQLLPLRTRRRSRARLYLRRSSSILVGGAIGLRSFRISSPPVPEGALRFLRANFLTPARIQ